MNIPFALIEALDITLGGFQKENQAFLISIFYKNEELLQIINQKMIEHKSLEKDTFGLILLICFDKETDAAYLNRFEDSHFKFESLKAGSSHANHKEYFLPLKNKSEKAAKTIITLIEKIFHIKKSKYLSFKFYEVE